MTTTTRKLRAVTVALLLPLVATTALASQANASGPHAQATQSAQRVSASVAIADKAGDVELEGDDDWFAPSLDIRKVTAAFDRKHKKLNVRVKFDDLRGLKHGTAMYKHGIYVHNESVEYTHTFALDRSPWAQGTTSTVYLGDTTKKCKGATWKIDLRSDVVTMRIPVSCLDISEKKAIKLSVGSQGMRSFMDGDQYVGGDYTSATAPVRIR